MIVLYVQVKSLYENNDIVSLSNARITTHMYVQKCNNVTTILFAIKQAYRIMSITTLVRLRKTTLALPVPYEASSL